MSFIFNPSPYEDDTAINRPEIDKEILRSCAFGFKDIANTIVNELSGKDCNIMGIDGAPSAQFERLANAIRSQATARGIEIAFVKISTIYKTGEELYKQFLYYLPEDKKSDPAQIFGKLYDQRYDTLFDATKCESLKKRLATTKSNHQKLIVYGQGAASEVFWDYTDRRIFFDVTNMILFLRIRNNEYTSLGDEKGLPVSQQFRRIYYIDFQLDVHLRETMIINGKMDWYLTADRDKDITMIGHDQLRTLLSRLVKRPFRCRPFYAEGVWGGYYLLKARNLPKDQFKNIAWSVDMNGMDNSLIIQLTEKNRIELPFLAFLEEFPEQIMGRELTRQFGRYFPIRFSYDDTFHSAGNMSIQCHPGDEFCIDHFNETMRQDEGYYVVVTGVGAKTYLGFKNGIKVDDFNATTRKSELDHIKFDHDAYVNSIPSIPGRQFMIPGGTIHSSGRNQVVLEIGSKVMGSYTFKQYDYVRLDLDGVPRPIHTLYGSQVLAKDRDADFVKEHLCKEPVLLKKGDTWEEYLVGEDDLVYYSCRQIRFSDYAVQDTRNSRFHGLVLVDGEKVTIKSKSNPECCYHMNYLDVVIVPSDIGEYIITNDDPIKQPVVVYKVQVKE